MRRGPDIITLIERALIAMARRAGCECVVLRASSVPWASAAFLGARHAVTVSLPASGMAKAWVDSLAETDFTIPRHLVADLVVISRRTTADTMTADVEILTVEER